MDRKLHVLLSQVLDGFPHTIIDAHRRQLTGERAALIAERERLLAERAHLPGDEAAERELLRRLGELAARVADMGFAERRALLLDLKTRVEPLSRTQVRVSTTISAHVLALAPQDGHDDTIERSLSSYRAHNHVHHAHHAHHAHHGHSQAYPTLHLSRVIVLP